MPLAVCLRRPPQPGPHHRAPASAGSSSTHYPLWLARNNVESKVQPDHALLASKRGWGSETDSYRIKSQLYFSVKLHSAPQTSILGPHGASTSRDRGAGQPGSPPGPNNTAAFHSGDDQTHWTAFFRVNTNKKWKKQEANVPHHQGRK